MSLISLSFALALTSSETSPLRNTRRRLMRRMLTRKLPRRGARLPSSYDEVQRFDILCLCSFSKVMGCIHLRLMSSMLSASTGTWVIQKSLLDQMKVLGKMSSWVKEVGSFDILPLAYVPGPMAAFPYMPNASSHITCPILPATSTSSNESEV